MVFFSSLGWSFHMWPIVIGNTCYYFVCIAKVKLLKVLRLSEIFLLNKYSAGVIFWNKFSELYFNFIKLGLPCEKPCAHSGIHPQKDWLSLGIGVRKTKWILKLLNFKYCRSIPYLNTLPNYIPYLSTLPNYSLS